MIVRSPEVTVVMACYNASPSLSQSIQSIVKQTFSNFNFIIIDDGSSDDSPIILNHWSDKDPRIQIVKNEKNIGLSASLNKAISLVSTPLIARMDADDEALFDRLELQVDFMNKHPNVDILGTSVFTRRSANEKCDGKIIMPSTHEEIVSRIFKKTVVLHPTLMAKTAVFKTIGTYDNDIRWAEDADLWYRIYDKVTWANLETPLLRYTVKSKLSRKIIYNNLKVKIKNLSRRGLLSSYIPVIAKDLLYYSYISIRQLFVSR